MKEKVYDHPGVSFHGECAIIEASQLGITELPADAKEVKAENGMHLVAHSESGHHHYVDAAHARFYRSDNPDTCYLMIEAGNEAYLKHMKPSSDPDRHGTQRLQSPLYVINLQQEETPEGLRRVED